MPGEMSQMVTVRPNAGAGRHQDRCDVIRRPRGGGFAPIVAHGSLRLTSLPTRAPTLATVAIERQTPRCRRLLAIFARNWEQHLALSPGYACALSWAERMRLFPRNALAECVHEVHNILRPRRDRLARNREPIRLRFATDFAGFELSQPRRLPTTVAPTTTAHVVAMAVVAVIGITPVITPTVVAAMAVVATSTL